MRLHPLVPAAALVLLLLAACDAPRDPAQPPPASPPAAVHVSLAPTSATVQQGGTVTFAASVANATSGAVTWSVPGASCGSVSQAGVYTAPGAPGTCSVVATSLEDPTSAASATVQVTAPPPPPPPVTVAVSPSPGAVNACKTLTFSATVTGTTDGAVTWSVQEGATGGAVTSAGVYTAPTAAGTYHVVATSHADPSKQAIVAVTVTTKVLSIAVTPVKPSVAPGGTVQLTATVTTTCGTFTSGG
jgi:hypothetical protein